MDKTKRKIDICVFSVFVVAAFAFSFFAMFDLDPSVFEGDARSGEKVSDFKEVGGVLAFLLAVSGFNVYIATKRSA